MRRLVAFIACLTCAVAIRAPVAAQEFPYDRRPVTAPFLLDFSIFLCIAGVVGFGVYPKPLAMAAPRDASSLF